MSSASLASSLDVVRAAQAGEVAVRDDELDRAIQLIVTMTTDSYSRHSEAYAAVRGLRTDRWEESLTRTLLSTVRGQIAERAAPPPRGARWRLLDVGAGSGRDLLRFAKESDVAPTALDNAPGLVRQLRALATAHGLPARSVIEGEMRDLSSLSSATFHCVRNHASLHHLPVVAPGHGADVAIAESRRVLVAGGVLYVLVRAGAGLTVIDTREGLGPRVFQLFSPELLTSLLERHRFRVLRVQPLDSKRGGETLRWVFCLAVSV